jgi:hypothetical protein
MSETANKAIKNRPQKAAGWTSLTLRFLWRRYVNKKSKELNKSILFSYRVNYEKFVKNCY